MAHLIVLMVLMSIAPLQRAPTNPKGKLPLIIGWQQQSTAIDRWLSSPTKIVLSKSQRMRLDTIRSNYVAERKVVNKEAKTQDEMATIVMMRDLEGKYRKAVRAILSPEQQAVFDKNVQVGFTVPRP